MILFPDAVRTVFSNLPKKDVVIFSVCCVCTFGSPILRVLLLPAGRHPQIAAGADGDHLPPGPLERGEPAKKREKMPENLGNNFRLSDRWLPPSGSAKSLTNPAPGLGAQVSKVQELRPLRRRDKNRRIFAFLARI